jgi:hypothetical protein
MPTDSVDAMTKEAIRQGWLEDIGLKMVPELVNIYSDAADYFMDVIDDTEPRLRETIVYHVCKYLFAKGVEGVIKWGSSPEGKLSVCFHAGNLSGNMDIELPKHLHKVVLDSQLVGESLFKAHSKFMLDCRSSGIRVDIREEISKSVEFISKLGVHYALFNNMQILR